MNLAKYNFTVDKTGCSYEFVSIGPKGAVKKVVHYIYHPQLGESVYNLGFGDWDDINMKINDTVISNNGDTLKILATVAATAMHFTKIYSDAWIFLREAQVRGLGYIKNLCHYFFKKSAYCFIYMDLKKMDGKFLTKGLKPFWCFAGNW